MLFEVTSKFNPLKTKRPTYMVRPCSENGRRNITQNSIEVDAETKESTRKTEEKLDGRYRVAQKERMFLKWVVVGRVSFFGLTSNQKSTFENLVQSTI